MFTIDEIALKNANAVPPTYYFSESPNTTYVDLRRHRPSGTPLTWFARLACRQSLSRGVRRIAGRTILGVPVGVPREGEEYGGSDCAQGS